MNVLYLPILEPGTVHDTAATHKRGLFDALARAGHTVAQYDYLDRPADVRPTELADLIQRFEPDILLSQFHGANILTPAQIRDLRALRPAMRWVNWSGDSWNHSLIAPPILDMVREFDVQLIAAPDVLPTYAEHGINAAYWQIAYEPPIGSLPTMPQWDVVWLANVINDKRRALMERLKALDGVRVGIYGDWEHADGRNVYHFAAGEALYQRATLAIADNVYPDQQRYISNRPIQCMAAGGAVLLHQHVPGMEALSYGWQNGIHYLEWNDADELIELIRVWHKPEHVNHRRVIVEAARAHVLTYHTFDARVHQLMELLYELA